MTTIESQVQFLEMLHKFCARKTKEATGGKKGRATAYQNFLILHYLKQEIATGPSAIALRLGMSPAAITGYLDTMEKYGYVYRERKLTGEGDRRKIDLTITEEGHKALAEFEALLAE